MQVIDSAAMAQVGAPVLVNQAPAHSYPHLGARPISSNKCEFLVWAPHAQTIDLHIVWPEELLLPMRPGAFGYFAITAEACPPGTQYFYRLNGTTDRPDPASKRQPRGVHGPSEVVPLTTVDCRSWSGISLSEYVIYELHVGTFTSEGTLDAIIPHLPRLKELGITAIELMPLAQFPGNRNWGYDGVYPFAVAECYGGVEALARLVSACHQHRLAVVLDVVYNHFGPEGNYFRDFGPYFTAKHQTPWGDAINFDGPESGQVRRFFIENALYWIRDIGIDALRLDAIHAILDTSAVPFLQELTAVVKNQGSQMRRDVNVIAECDLNDSRFILPVEKGGFGLDAQWGDDFHHCIHTLLTRESSGYYQDFGQLAQLAEALKNGWVYSGQYSKLRRRNHGNSTAELGANQFVVCSQNHDQIGNRMNGERLLELTDWDKARLAAATVLLSPYIPLLFMGEEYGETAPFLYFVDHTDPDLREAVRQGRAKEFESFHQGNPPDPAAVETFLRSKLNPSLLETPKHAQMQAFYKELLTLRKEYAAVWAEGKQNLNVELFEESETILITRTGADQHLSTFLHYGDDVASVTCSLPPSVWTVILNSASKQWGGTDEPKGWTLDRRDVVTLRLPRYSCLVLSGVPV